MVASYIRYHTVHRIAFHPVSAPRPTGASRQRRKPMVRYVGSSCRGPRALRTCCQRAHWLRPHPRRHSPTAPAQANLPIGAVNPCQQNPWRGAIARPPHWRGAWRRRACKRRPRPNRWAVSRADGGIFCTDAKPASIRALA